MKGIRRWLAWHSLTRHALVPLWKRAPERVRWWVAEQLNRSRRTCWCHLVDAAMHPTDGRDPCDGHLPTLTGGEDCRTECRWLVPEHTDHTECTCYCGKFRGLVRAS